MTRTQKRFLFASLSKEGLPLFGEALCAALALAVPLGMLSAANALKESNPEAFSALGRPALALCILLAAMGMLQSMTAAFGSVRTQGESIGMRKALGFTPRDITRHHVSMHLICGVLAAALGLIMSICLVQLPILSMLAPGAALGLAPFAALTGSMLVILLPAGAAYAACVSFAKRSASELMRGDAALGNPQLLSLASGSMPIRRLMALRSLLVSPFSLLVTLACSMLGVMAFVLSLGFAAQSAPLAFAGAALSALMLAVAALSQMTTHIARQAQTMATMRDCGYTRREIRAFAVGGMLALMASGLVLGGILGALLDFMLF